MNELLKDFTFVVDLNIEWGDMDALQHVNNIESVSYTHLTLPTNREV